MFPIISESQHMLFSTLAERPPFLAVDIEAWERRPYLILEIGISISTPTITSAKHIIIKETAIASTASEWPTSKSLFIHYHI